VVNQTSLNGLQLGLEHKNLGHGPSLLKGQSTWFIFIFLVENVNNIKYSVVNSRLMFVNKTSSDVNPPILGDALTKYRH
jgi:hypothetical protein